MKATPPSLDDLGAELLVTVELVMAARGGIRVRDSGREAEKICLECCRPSFHQGRTSGR